MSNYLVSRIKALADAFVLAQKMAWEGDDFDINEPFCIPTREGAIGIVFALGRIDIHPGNKVTIRWRVLQEDKEKFEEQLMKYEFYSIEESSRDKYTSILYELKPKYKSVKELIEIITNLINI